MVMARGNYTFEDIQLMTADELLFLNHYQEVQLKEQQKFLTDILGVVFDAKTFEDRSEFEGRSKDTVLIPLSMAINPKILEWAKEHFGKGTEKVPHIAGGTYQPAEGEQVKSMADMSKEDFLQMIGQATGKK